MGPRRVNDEIVAATAAAWKQAKPATLAERRILKKATQPEHAYTGYASQEL